MAVGGAQLAKKRWHVSPTATPRTLSLAKRPVSCPVGRSDCLIKGWVQGVEMAAPIEAVVVVELILVGK